MAVDRGSNLCDYYSCDKQFLKANEGLVTSLIETSITTANASDIERDQVDGATEEM